MWRRARHSYVQPSWMAKESGIGSMSRSRRGVLARMLAGVLPAAALLATASAALADWQEDLAA